MRLRHMRRFTGNPVCGTTSLLHLVAHVRHGYQMLWFSADRTSWEPLWEPLSFVSQRSSPEPGRRGGRIQVGSDPRQVTTASG
jgi:hypothetical protein